MTVPKFHSIPSVERSYRIIINLNNYSHKKVGSLLGNLLDMVCVDYTVFFCVGVPTHRE